jgi:DNA-nicking Smr family endonuclease
MPEHGPKEGSDNDDLFDPEAPIELPITDILDLHSFPPRDAKAVVEEYLREAHKRGFVALWIIHGRGIGVQRDMVRGVLARTPFVASFGDAPLEAGGWGATLVTLQPADETANSQIDPA